MSSTNRPFYTRVMESACFFLMAGMGVVLFRVGQTFDEPTVGKVNIGTLVAATPFGAFISFILAVAISCLVEPYSRYARDLRTWVDDWADYCCWVLDVIWNMPAFMFYWLAYEVWAARYIIWYRRQLLRREKSLIHPCENWRAKRQAII